MQPATDVINIPGGYNAPVDQIVMVNINPLQTKIVVVAAGSIFRDKRAKPAFELELTEPAQFRQREKVLMKQLEKFRRIKIFILASKNETFAFNPSHIKSLASLPNREFLSIQLTKGEDKAKIPKSLFEEFSKGMDEDANEPNLLFTNGAAKFRVKRDCIQSIISEKNQENCTLTMESGPMVGCFENEKTFDPKTTALTGKLAGHFVHLTTDPSSYLAMNVKQITHIKHDTLFLDVTFVGGQTTSFGSAMLGEQTVLEAFSKLETVWNGIKNPTTGDSAPVTTEEIL